MKLYTKFLFLCSLFCLGACSWLDIEPEGEATSEKLFSTGDGIRSVLSGVYKAMTSSNLYGKELQFGLVDCISQQYTWDWDYNSDTQKNLYKEAKAFNYKDVDLRKAIDAIWADGYNVIANANNLIQEIKAVSPDVFAGGEMERDMILGEAYALRGLMHFDLCRLFAPAVIENETDNYLPYVDTYPNIQPMGIDVKTYLEKVVADLEEGRRLTESFDLSLLGQSVSASYRARYEGTLESGMEGYSKEKDLDDFFLGRGFRLSHYAITAILARVYQYMGNDEKAFDYADKVLTFKAKGKTETSYDMFASEEWNNLWVDKLEERPHLKMPSNLIFALYNEDAYEDYGIGSYFMKKAQGNSKGQWFVIDYMGQGFFTNPATENSELKDDARSKFLLFTPEYESFLYGDPRYISAKWYASDVQTIRQKNMEILPVIRTTEMRYIKAEILAKKGQFGDAYQILNEIRRNRFVYEDLPTESDMNKFLRDLVNDAQREYLSEGQLFYLYKRLGYKVKIGNEVRKLTKSEYMFPLPEDQNM